MKGMRSRTGFPRHSNNTRDNRRSVASHYTDHHANEKEYTNTSDPQDYISNYIYRVPCNSIHAGRNHSAEYNDNSSN